MMSESTNHTWGSNHSDVGSSLDAERIASFQFYAWGVAGNCISLLGLVGNALSLAVLCHRKLRTSTSVFLASLAIYDSIVLISLVLFMALPTLHLRALRPYMAVFPYIQPYGYPLALTAQTCSIYTTVGFTVERYIAVCHPLRAQQYCSIARAQKAVLAIFLVSVAYNVPRMLEYHTVVMVTPGTNVTTAVYTYTALGQSSLYRHAYFIYLHIVFMLVLPCAVLAVLNLALVRAVRRSSHAEGKQLSSRQRTENNLTVMLISVVAVFLVCEVPSIVDNIAMATVDAATISSAPFIKLTCVSSLMVITNSAINFYLYCVFGERFRRVFVAMFCSWCRGSAQSRSRSVSYRDSVIRASVRSGPPKVTLWAANKDSLGMTERHGNGRHSNGHSNGMDARCSRVGKGKSREYAPISSDSG